jgi:alkylation response protein AidB-like acyl-CoA dehydrogenase
VERKALKITHTRVVAAAQKALSERKPDPAPSLLKVKGCEIPQSISALMVGATGPYGITAPRGEALRANEPEIVLDWAVMAQPIWVDWRKLSIYGGTNEIQRNVMATAFMGK